MRYFLFLCALFSGVLGAADFTSVDINTDLQGKTVKSGLTGYDISGGGEDIWFSKDSFRFVYIPCSGDFDIKVRIASIQRQHEWTKAGLMVRQSTDPGSAHAMMVFAASGQFAFQHRSSSKGEMSHHGGSQNVNGPVWVRLIRAGDCVTGYEATNDDGSNWREVGVKRMGFTGEVLLGMCVTAHKKETLSKVEFRELEVELDVKGTRGRGNGLKGTYFDNDKLTGNGTSRLDPLILFDWDQSAPLNGLPADNYSIRWEGMVEAAFDEEYVFYAKSDDGVRLWLNHQLIIDNWRGQSATEVRSAPVAMKAGEKVPLRVEYFDYIGEAQMSLRWSSKSTLKQIIPTRRLYADDGLVATADAAPAASGTRVIASTPRPEDPAPAQRSAASRGQQEEYVPLDKNLAAALAAGAAKLAADNKPEKARELCFKALANDETCPEALFELGKILEKDGKNVEAANFFVRAAREWSKSADAPPAVQTKRADAERRVQALNPHAARFTALLTDYALEIGAALKKNNNDSLSLELAGERVRSLRLKELVAADKLPRLEKTSAAGGPAAKAMGPAIPLDVERALKAAGWTAITGRWTKKAENVYEVSEGKLSATLTNGALQVLVHKGGSGSVKAFVRNGHNDSIYSSYYSYGSGYGVAVEGNSCKLYTPLNYTGQIYRPYSEREVALPEAFPKHQFLVTVMDGNLEITVNGKREHRSNYKLSREGPFVIDIDGTMTIEMPQAKGQ
ncbi:MAG TPA: PA14 domain-containing protein [Planctomycetota bacterium]|nr:PA14 domain-containing protein [Planctomycetota bacterium]